MDLKNHWQKCLTICNIESYIAEQLFFEIQKQYSEHGRYYHNLTHISKMLETLDGYISKIEHPQRLLFAVWFHDIVYNPLKKDNEKQSAEFAHIQLSKLKLSDTDISEICRYIERTANHFVREFDEPYEMQLLLDSDLQSLGSNPEQYIKNTENIRLEYSMIPDALFNAGRAKVLRNFINMPSIYRTPDFIEKYEIQARINLQNELNFLQ